MDTSILAICLPETKIEKKAWEFTKNATSSGSLFRLHDAIKCVVLER